MNKISGLLGLPADSKSKQLHVVINSPADILAEELKLGRAGLAQCLQRELVASRQHLFIKSDNNNKHNARARGTAGGWRARTMAEGKQVAADGSAPAHETLRRRSLSAWRLAACVGLQLLALAVFVRGFLLTRAELPE
eukprot:scaffold561617_cov46-Prasinocladus_malaysianus.AAC.1